MIKLLLSRKQLLLFIIIAWSLLAFVSYNVLTVHAEKKIVVQSQPDDDIYCDEFDWGPFHPDRQFVDELCDASEDYAKNPKNCDKAYKLVEEQEEIAADEDALCDDEDADTTDIKSCMSASRQQQAAHNYDKESCEEVNGDWNKKKGSGCTFYEDEQQDILDAAEDQRRIIDEEEQQALAAIDEYNAAQAQEQQEEDFLSEENVEKSIGFPGENEPGFIKTPEQKRAEEQEFIAELEDDLFDAKTPEQKEKIQGQLDKAREKFGPYKDEEKLTGYDEEGRQLNVINGDYDEEPEQIEDYGNTVSEEQIKEEAKKITDSEPWTNYPIEQKPVEEEVSEQDEEEVAEYNEDLETEAVKILNGPVHTTTVDEEEKENEDLSNTVSYSEEEQIQNEENEITPEEADEINEQNEQEEEEVADNNEDDNQVNTDTEDSSDNTDSSDSQESSDSEDNSSDDGGDSSDSGDDSSSNDDGGDSGDSSESEE